MLVLVVPATIHWLAALGQAASVDPLSQQVLARVANPLLTSAQFLIPAAVAISRTVTASWPRSANSRNAALRMFARAVRSRSPVVELIVKILNVRLAIRTPTG